MRVSVGRLLPFGVFVVLALLLWRGLSLDPHHLPATRIGQSLPNFDVPMLLPPQHSRFTAQLLKGHISLLVVWASWCEACQEEQVFLFDLAHQGIVLFGLNYKDDPVAAQHWLAEWGNPYQAIGQDTSGQVALDLGVYGAPETYLIDQQGLIQYRYAGILNPEVWKREFQPRITTLRRNL